MSSLGSVYRKDALESLTQRNREVILKVGLDQLFWQAPLLNFYLMFMSILEGLSVKDGWERCKKDFHDTWMAAIVFWSPVMYLNFALVPVELHPLVVNVLCIVWTMYLSLRFHQRDYGGQNVRISADAALTVDSENGVVADERSVVERLSVMVGRAMESAVAASELTAAAASVLAARSKVAVSAASVAWTETAPGAESSGVATDAEMRLRRQTESQAKQLQEQQDELEIMRRTVVSQALRIQALQEAAESHGRPITDDVHPGTARRSEDL
jgi:hypothetical protein